MLSGAFHDVAHPILPPSFYFALGKLALGLKPRKVFLQIIDCKLSALPFLHLASFPLRQPLVISAVLFESAQELERKLRSKLRLKALKRCEPISCASEAQMAVLMKFGLVARLVSDFSCFERQSETLTSSGRHGRVRLVFRGKELLSKFLKSDTRLCQKCTYEVHLPEEEKHLEMPLNFQKTDRLITGQPFFEAVLRLRHQVFLYDQLFDLPSARVNDSLMAGVPCAVPSGGQLERQVQKHGNGLTFDSDLPDFEYLLNHPQFSDEKKRVLTVEEFLDEDLATAPITRGLPNFWLTFYCITEMMRFLFAGAIRVARRNARALREHRRFDKHEGNDS